MKNFKKFFFKSTLIILIFGTISSCAFIPKAQAFSDYGAVGAAATWGVYWSNVANKVARDILAKKINDYVNDLVLSWIQGGGSPKFATDLNQIFDEIANKTNQKVFSQILNIESCVPYSDSNSTPQTQFSKALRCSLLDTVDNVSDFQNNFDNGGWEAFGALIKDPGNTTFGVLNSMIAKSSYETYRESQNTKTEIESNDGYLSTKRCRGGITASSEADVPPGYTQDSTGKWCDSSQLETITPGSTIGAVVARNLTSDIEWGSNIESWMSALVNAMVTRLTQDGVGLAGMGNASTGGTYIAPEAAAEIRKNFVKIKVDIDKYVAKGTPITENKLETANTYEKVLSDLQSVKGSCPNLVTDQDITDTEGKVTSSRKSSDKYQSMMLVANDLKIRSDVDLSTNTEEMMSINNDYNDFANTYPGDMISDDALSTSLSEKSAADAAYSSSQDKVNLCH